MQITPNNQPCHLSYCTNIHPGESADAICSGIARHVPAIRAAACPAKPFGLGLRVAAEAVHSLQQPTALEQLRATLEDTNSYVFTINGFPYGNFHGQRVKENVYSPDWADPERLNYTNQLATLLDGLLPANTSGSISTVPGTFKPWVNKTPDVHRSIAANIVEHVAHLVALQRVSGKTIVLALEPEPFCLLETIAETVEFFVTYLHGPDAQQKLSKLTGLSQSDSEIALRTHIGLCYDVCHAAVEYENASDSVSQLQEHGIDISKLQLSSALRINDMSPEKAEHLRPFDEPVYLHQVIQRASDGTLTRYRDIEDAMSNLEAAIGTEWRVHFHVPIFLEKLLHFDTTQAFLKEILALQLARNLTSQLEVETYTWDVLPEEYRGVDVSTAIARELNWVLDELSVNS